MNEKMKKHMFCLTAFLFVKKERELIKEGRQKYFACGRR
jgi:hypothetical protein